jgi:hypothetical protein
MQLPSIQNAWIGASFPIETVHITESGTWTVPFNVTHADIFAIGGGGNASQSDTSGNGGNDGRVVTENITVLPGYIYETRHFLIQVACIPVLSRGRVDPD